MLFLYLLKQIAAVTVVAFVVAAPHAAKMTSLGPVKRDHPPPGMGGDPGFFPFPTTNSEWPCWSGGVSRASCMFGTLPTSTSTSPAVSTIWVQPVPSPAFTPTVFDPSPGRTKTVTGPHKTKTVTDELVPTATWTQTATWTEVATWTETLLGSAPTEVPYSEPEESAESEEASEGVVKRSRMVMTKNSRRVKLDTMALAGSTITAEGDPIFTILPISESNFTTEAEPMFTILPMPEVNSETMTAGPTLTTEAEPTLTILPMPESTFTTEAEPTFTILPMPDVNSAVVSRNDEQVCISACKFDTDQPACQETCNKDLVSFTQAYCKYYVPSCKVDKESEQCMGDCASILPEGMPVSPVATRLIMSRSAKTVATRTSIHFVI